MAGGNCWRATDPRRCSPGGATRRSSCPTFTTFDNESVRCAARPSTMSRMPFSAIPDVLEDLKSGKPIVLVDDEDRENEGDIVIAAEHCTPAVVNFISKNARGLICLS